MRAHQPNTLPEELRFQARAIMGHIVLSGLLLFGAGYVGMLFEPIPNWTIMVFVWMVGGLGNLAVSYAARKAEAAG